MGDAIGIPNVVAEVALPQSAPRRNFEMTSPSLRSARVLIRPFGRFGPSALSVTAAFRK